MREDYEFSVHAVVLSLGSVDGLDEAHLEGVVELVKRLKPVLVSAHLSWSVQDGRYLNDLLFCERRLALHLVEQIWKDNQYTAEGEYAHRKVDQSANLKRGDKRNVTGMMLVSYRLGVTGKADLVEFRSADVSSAPGLPAASDCGRDVRAPRVTGSASLPWRQRPVGLAAPGDERRKPG